MHNTILYILTILISIFVVLLTKYSIPIKIILFFVTYYSIFIILEILHYYFRFYIWNQTERTTECYDWFEHYFKKDYGVINGKRVYDYSENIYLDNFNTPSEQSLKNKYDLIFKELRLSEGKKLLDCGCGMGNWMNYCKERGVDVIGLTLSKEQQLLITKKGMTAYVQDFRILNKNFINSFDAISLLGSTEHITYYEGPGNMNEKSFRNYKDLFSVLKQYLKPNGKILLTSLVQCRPIWSFYDYIQSYILERHYGGYYSRTELIEKSITDNGFKINSIKDFTKDYHWISIVEPDHFGHWWIHWEEDTLKMIMYILYLYFCYVVSNHTFYPFYLFIARKYTF